MTRTTAGGSRLRMWCVLSTMSRIIPSGGNYYQHYLEKIEIYGQRADNIISDPGWRDED